MAIRVTCGDIDGIWHRGDVVTCYDEAEEAFLVGRGVAEYVGDAPAEPQPMATEPAQADEPSYKQLQARARALGIPAHGKRDALGAAIAEAEAALDAEEDYDEDDEPPALTAEVPE